MNYDKEILNNAISKAVDKMNEIVSLDNKFVYRYDYENDWYDILHSVENEIQTNDQVARSIVDILNDELLSKEIYNFSIYEDKKAVLENTYEFPANTKKTIYDKFIKNNSNFKINDIRSKPTKRITAKDVKIA